MRMLIDITTITLKSYLNNAARPTVKKKFIKIDNKW